MDMYEDVLVPVLEAFGTLREVGTLSSSYFFLYPVAQVRLKIDPGSGLGRGFCLVVYSDAEEARTCVKALHNFQIAPSHRLKVGI